MATNNSIDNQIGSGNFTITSGNLLLPTTSSTIGQITINAVPFLHGYGTDNVFLGNNSGNFTLSGANSVALGTSSGTALTSGNGLVFIGKDCGKAATTIINTTAIGYQSCYTPTSAGSYSSFLGYQAGYRWTNTEAVGIGYMALYGGANPSYAKGCIAIGSNALKSVTGGNSGDGEYNVVIGYRAGMSITSGASNICIGSGNDGSNNDGACAAYGTEYGNICLGTKGVAGDSDVIRIGATGIEWNFNHNKVYIYSVYNYAGTMNARNCAVSVDKDGQLQACRSAANDATCKTLSIYKSRGTSTIASGDALGVFDFRGYDGTNYIAASQITSTNSGTVATNRIASDLKFYTHPDSTTASTLRYTIDSTGLHTITAPDAGSTAVALGVGGNIQCVPTYSNVVTGNAVLVDSSGNYGVTSSSIRYKENIKDMADSSSFIEQLRPVTFTYKTDTKKTQKFGLIAEEVIDIAPHLVLFDKDDKPEAVAYHELPAILLNEIQKLMKRVAILEAKLKEK